MSTPPSDYAACAAMSAGGGAITVVLDPSADTVIWPNDGLNAVMTGSNNLYNVGGTLYLNTHTTSPGLLISETQG
eukprot:SAG22_NODE_7197_length_763_cov_1.385542_2_plen_74_part_01